MKQLGLVLLGGACVLALSIAYFVGHVRGAGSRVDVSGSSREAEGGRFWRFEVELASGTVEDSAVEPPDGIHRASPLDLAERVPHTARSYRLEAPRPEAGPKLAAAVESEEPLKQSLVSGPLLEGWYENGELHFRGHQVRTQEGVWLREGPWEAWHDNGTIDELGSYRDDEEHGEWQWFYATGGRKAEGQFVHGERVGGWLFWHENGRQMMEGLYVDGERSGSWVYHHDNGVRAAQGIYEAGQPVGEWSFWLADGTIDDARTGFYDEGELVRGR